MKEKQFDLGSRLKQLFREVGLSNRKVAELAHMNEAYLSRILNNRLDPSFSSIEGLLHVLGFKISLIEYKKRDKFRKPCFQRIAMVKREN